MKISELFSIKGKVAVITGASSGLGVTFAEALGKQRGMQSRASGQHTMS